MSLTESANGLAEQVLEFNRGRKPKGLRRKFARMARDPFAFFRGANHLFAGDWEHVQPPDVGPAILLCGDLHLENFGAVRTDAGADLFDINDFDDALVGPVSLDVVRCAASVLLAAEVWGLRPLKAAGMAIDFLDAYRVAVAESHQNGAAGRIDLDDAVGDEDHLLGIEPPGSAEDLVGRLTREGRHGGLHLRHDPKTFPRIGRSRREAAQAAVEAYGRGTNRAEEFAVLDVAGRLAGIGSLGLRRDAVLIAGGADGPRVLDLKEIGPPSLLAVGAESQPDFGDEARRAVAAQKLLQADPPALLDALEIDGVMYRLRAMVPDENRADLGRLARKPNRLRRAVAIAGRAAGQAHYRGARFVGHDRGVALAAWAAGPALDAALVAAARVADRTRTQHADFKAARKAGLLDPKVGLVSAEPAD